MFNILIVNEQGNEIETIQSPINPIGTHSIVTEKAVYDCIEFAVDYKKNQIVVHVENDFMEFN